MDVRDGPRVTYHGYLHLDDLLSLQRPAAGHPDEMHFIVVHQGTELWFRLILHDLARVVRLLDEDRLGEAMMLLRRLNHSVDVLVSQVRSLRDLPPDSFQQFRSWFGNASGAQSLQFRQIELRSGLRDSDYLSALPRLAGDPLPDTLREALTARSLADAHLAAASRHGVADWAAFYMSGAGSPCYLLSELLLDYDEAWLRWRSEHLALVHRLSGVQVRGTGGTDPGSYLANTLRYRFFPYLWDLRHRVAVRNGAHLTV